MQVDLASLLLARVSLAMETFPKESALVSFLCSNRLPRPHGSPQSAMTPLELEMTIRRLIYLGSPKVALVTFDCA